MSDHDSDSSCSINKDELRVKIQEQNRKKRKSGGFQAMGLSNESMHGILKCRYKVPTPIQRKAIPVLLSGRDVVAMARTGSGKTAAFLIPMFERLKGHCPKGPRALVISPTRELSTQTNIFIGKLGSHFQLRVVILLGGESTESQFERLHQKPDIIVATPGRLCELLVEMGKGFKLNTIEYVVFDEGDRLFEDRSMASQLEETVQQLPVKCQKVIMSATLPSQLKDFAMLRFNDPVAIRLDVDTKLSENLKMGFLYCNNDDKISVLIHLLRLVVSRKEQAVVFIASKHHIDYLAPILSIGAEISCGQVYSSMDAEARKINTMDFRKRKLSVLLVTDIAHRGLDIPSLDNVINFHFPDKPKKFVHRVGRVARAGRMGTAYSLVANDELPYLLDLFLFLGRPLKLVPVEGSTKQGLLDAEQNGYLGRIPQTVIDKELSMLENLHATTDEVNTLKQCSERSLTKYMRVRPVSCSASIARSKELITELVTCPYHPIFSDDAVINENRESIQQKLRMCSFNQTIFEGRTSNTKSGVKEYGVMKAVRSQHTGTVNPYPIRQKEDWYASVTSKPHDSMSFIPFKKKGESDFGLNLDTDSTAPDDFFKSSNESKDRSRPNMHWDRKKKKFVGHNNAIKKIKTASGVRVPASYKSGRYETWLKKSNCDSSEVATEKWQSKMGKKLQVLKPKPRNFHTRTHLDTDKPNKKSQVKNKAQVLKEYKTKQLKGFIQKGFKQRRSVQAGKVGKKYRKR